MNKAIMIGTLTKDPEMRTTGSGISVCTMRIAVPRRRANQSGERVSDFFDVIAWRGLADLCAKYLEKGKKACFTGELQTRSYDAKDGTKRYVTEIVCDDVEFLTPKGGREQKDETQDDEEYHTPEGFTPTDDELPF
jgi:single-strand DNA-binding protein